MPILVTVPGTSATWTDTGVVLHVGDGLSVIASGAIEFENTGTGGTTTDPSGGLPQPSPTDGPVEYPIGIDGGPEPPGGTPPTVTKGIHYGLPEGAYPPDCPSTHAEDPGDVLQNSYLSSGQLAGLAALNTVPFSLVLAFVTDGTTPPIGVTYGLRPDRMFNYSAADVAAAAIGAGPWRVFAIFNDYDYTDNSGLHSLTLQPISGGSTIMSDRFTINNGVQFGKETTLLTPAAAPNRLVSMNLTPEVNASFKKHRTSGFKRADLNIIEKEYSTAKYDGIATYNELGYFLSSLIAKPVSQLITTGVNQHTFQSSQTQLDALNSFTFEYGSNVSMERFSGGMVPSMDWKMNRDDIAVSGDIYGGRILMSVNDGISLTLGANETQTLTLTGATGGTYALSFNGASTGPIMWNASAATIQTALQGLSSIGAGNATVTGSGPFVITFAGALAGITLPLIVANGAALTGSTPTATVAETTKGGLTQLAKVPILPGDVSVYLSTTSYADLNNTANQNLRNMESDWSIKDRHMPFWTQNAGLPSWTGTVEDEKMSETITLTVGMAPGNQGQELLPHARAGSFMWVRIQAISSEFMIPTTSTPYKFTLDACCKIEKVNPFKDDQGLWCASYDLQMTPDPNFGNVAYILTLLNEITAY